MNRPLLPLLTALAVPAALAFEARTPIWEPITIDEPGAYVLTRDLSGPGVLITVDADGVELDLNGHRLVASLNSIALHISSAENVRVHDGTLRGGGVQVSSSAAVWLERLDLESTIGVGIYLSSSSAVSIRDCVIHDSQSDAIRSWGAGPFLVESTVISRALSDGLSLDSPHGSLISDLSIDVAPGFATSGISLYNADGNRLSDIRIDATDAGSAVDVFGAAGSRFTGIRVNTCDGDAFSVFDGSEDSLWEENSAVGCAEGIAVYSNRTTLRRNLLSGNASGVEIYGDDNVISGNVSRGNSIDDYYLSGLSSGNTSAGNNFVPTLQ